MNSKFAQRYCQCGKRLLGLILVLLETASALNMGKYSQNKQARCGNINLSTNQAMTCPWSWPNKSLGISSFTNSICSKTSSCILLAYRIRKSLPISKKFVFAMMNANGECLHLQWPWHMTRPLADQDSSSILSIIGPKILSSSLLSNFGPIDLTPSKSLMAKLEKRQKFSKSSDLIMISPRNLKQVLLKFGAQFAALHNHSNKESEIGAVRR